MILTTVATTISGVIAVLIILIGARFLLAPKAAAAGFGLPVAPTVAQTAEGSPNPWLDVKGVRDIASGIFLLILLANGAPHLLGGALAAASMIPLSDALIALRSGASMTIALGIHGATGVTMLASSAVLVMS
ncbi:DUF4267 domain-containing protein [Polymorphobacter megasporae]|uniref:DUF4267 domain-containing protein n=1 Tax=Glacieibacterium megasporae TaxID=2835787 RepID=UPI001C1DE74E|nr:DUF4267 domain-containing protein [Polymorphobacter megasporae]UAJ10672.1 DUF4267 domain-containing protein [Polymorphobacter megasporae]